METPSSEGSLFSRTALVNKLFGELQAGFERIVARASPPPATRDGGVREPTSGAETSSGTAPPGGGGRSRAGVPLRVTRAAPRPGGLEFLVEGPAGKYSFLNFMDGIILVFRQEGGQFQEHRWVSYNFEGGVPRAIERLAGVPRAPFKYTSLPRLLGEFLCS